MFTWRIFDVYREKDNVQREDWCILGEGLMYTGRMIDLYRGMFDV